VRDAAGEVKTITSLLEEARLRAGRLRWVPEAEELVQTASRCSQEAARKRSEAQAISGLLEAAEEAQTQRGVILDLAPVESLLERAKAKRVEYESLDALLLQVQTTEDELCRHRETSTRRLEELREATPELCETCGQPLPDPS
jgi:hypothetical protein